MNYFNGAEFLGVYWIPVMHKDYWRAPVNNDMDFSVVQEVENFFSSQAIIS
jgi:hypothetical protein